MRRLVGALALVLAMPPIVACTDTGSCLGPVQTINVGAGAIVASLGEGRVAVPVDQDEAGSCPVEVEFDGRLYTNTSVTSLLYDGWALTDADLSPLGRATRSTVGSTYRDDAVYAIRGVDVTDAIAMHDASRTGVVVLVKDRSRFPIAVCRYLTKTPIDPAVCAPAPQYPSPS